MLRYTTIVLTILAAIAMQTAASAADWGNLSGRFVFDGDPPQPKPVNVDKDTSAFGNLGLVDESLLVSDEGGVANVVIYVRTRDVAVHPDIEKNLKPQVTLDNKGGRFVPRILPLWLGKQELLLHNSDKVPHNSAVQPIGDVAANPLLPPGTEVEHQFNRVQIIPVPVSCSIHSWMRGYVLPRDNPYVAVSAADGTFKLENLPAGELEFQVWQEKSGYAYPNEWPAGCEPVLRASTNKPYLGRFTYTVNPGANDLGAIKLDPELFNK